MLEEYLRWKDRPTPVFDEVATVGGAGVVELDLDVEDGDQELTKEEEAMAAMLDISGRIVEM